MTVLYGDARDKIVDDKSVQCVITSPPYWGLRKYGDSTLEIGTGSLDEYIEDIRAVGARMYDALADDGIFWLNIGDTASGSGGAGGDFKSDGSKSTMPKYRQGQTAVPKGQWCLVPQRVALALQQDGWLVRHWITWDKGQYRPEHLTHVKRPLISSEVIIMLTKSSRYKFYASHLQNAKSDPQGSQGLPQWHGDIGNVWHFPAARGKRSHMAPFPSALPARCILLSTDIGDTVLDPFVGKGTTIEVAERLGRNGVGIDIYSYEESMEGVTNI